MFGCVVAGRLLQTNLVLIDETQAIFQIPNPESINHLCVFLLGTVSFPDGYGATIHFHLPGKGFQVLGMLSNAKPSAIFRVKSVFSDQNISGMDALSTSAINDSSDAILGIAIAPLDTVQAQVASLHQSPSSIANPLALSTSSSSRLSDPTYLAQKIGQNMFNFLASFAVPGSSSVQVRMADLEAWYEKFINRIKQAGPGFLDRSD